MRLARYALGITVLILCCGASCPAPGPPIVVPSNEPPPKKMSSDDRGDSGDVDITVTPGPIIVIGTGTGSKISVMAHTDEGGDDVIDAAEGESSNRVNMMLTWIVDRFEVYDSASDVTPDPATQLSVFVGSTEKLRISKIGQQFHWQYYPGGVIPEVCETTDNSGEIPDCSTNSYGIPAALVGITQAVTLKAISQGHPSLTQIHHATLEGASP